MTTNANAKNISDDSPIHKASKQSKTFTCGALRLKVQQDFLEKNVASAISRLKLLDRQLSQDISALQTNMNNKRCHERERMDQAVNSIVESWREVKGGVSSLERLQNLDLATYGKSVFHLEKKLEKFKENNNIGLHLLEEKETELTAQLNGAERVLDRHSKRSNPSLFKPIVKSTAKSQILRNDNTKEEVQIFQRFLEEHGGHTGGWDDQDHLLFLRLRNKHKGRTSFLSLLRQHLPDISADEMLKHENWYQQYLDLKDKKKQAIQQWKSSREEKKKRENTSAHEVCKTDSKNSFQKSSNERKRQLEEWKKTLELKKQLEEKKEWEEKQKQLEKEQKKKELLESQKAKVEQYKEEKKAQEQNKLLMQQLKELQETEERFAKSKMLLKSFRDQDEIFIARRLSLCKAKAQEKERQERRLEQLRGKVHVVAERDPERLLRPTALWKERCRQRKLESTEHKPLLNVNNMPHLAVPEWRKCVS